MIEVKFQFHKGTIRTYARFHIGYSFEFQFHKGTIRTLCAETWHTQNQNFNSIKVRLEQIQGRR